MENKKILLTLLLTPLLFSCQTENNISKYPDYVGDIKFNPNIDKEDFSLCLEKRIFQYFNDSNGVQYEGEKIAIDRIFFTQYRNQYLDGETGLIRINFVVNCKGETDRFRLIGMDENYKLKSFDTKITNQLMTITKALKGWRTKKIQGHDIDYYQYLIFKIKNGNLIEIMP